MWDWLKDNLHWLCPMIVTVLFAILNTIVAKTNLKLAKLQQRIQNDEFCFQLYEKRMSIYEAADKILCSAEIEGSVAIENLHDFLSETRNVKFLFGDDMREKCTEIYSILNKLCTIGTVINHNIEHSKKDSNHKELCVQEKKLFDTLSFHRKELGEIAKKYLSFSNYNIQNH